MTNVEPGYFLVLAGLMFTIGVVGVLIRRNAIVIFMFVELMLNAVNINLVAFGAYRDVVAGQVFALFVITIAAAEVGVGLAIVLQFYRLRQAVAVDEVTLHADDEQVVR